MPGIIGSLILIISGAVAKFAYSESVWTWTSGGESHTLQVDTIGTILLIAGLVAMALSVAYSFKGNEELIEEEAVVEKEPDVLPLKAKKTTRKKSQ